MRQETMLMTKKRILNILDTHDKNDKAARIVEVIIISLVLLNVAAVMLESVNSIYIKYKTAFYAFNAFSVAIFTIEYVLQIWSQGSRYAESSWRGRKEYIFSFHGIIDLLAILPFFLTLIFPLSLDLRFIRVLRLSRLFKISQYSSAIQDFFIAIYSQRRAFGAAAYILIVAIVFSAIIFYYAETGAQPKRVASILDALYWSVITITTVGYGDITPVTGVGRLVASIASFLGVSTVAIFTGVIATSYMNQITRKRANQKTPAHESQEKSSVKTANHEEHVLARLQAELKLSDEFVEDFKKYLRTNKKKK